MQPTLIQWADEVWNPFTGCDPDPISPGCNNCYARKMANRLRGRSGYPKENPFAPTFHPDRISAPGERIKGQTVFVCSMGDIALADWEQFDRIFTQMEGCRYLPLVHNQLYLGDYTNCRDAVREAQLIESLFQRHLFVRFHQVGHYHATDGINLFSRLLKGF